MVYGVLLAAGAVPRRLIATGRSAVGSRSRLVEERRDDLDHRVGSLQMCCVAGAVDHLTWRALVPMPSTIASGQLGVALVERAR